MGIYTHIPCSPTQTLSFSVRDVLLPANGSARMERDDDGARFRISILLGHTKVYYIDRIRTLRRRSADEEVVGFDISVDQILLVNSLHS